MSMNEKAEEIIKHNEKYTGKTLKNYPSPGAPGATLQNNATENSTLRNTGHWLDKRCFIVLKLLHNVPFQTSN